MEEKQTILAVGAGASTKMVFPNEERIERIENVKDVDLYIKKIDEMIDRKRKFIEENECFKREEMPEAITHGICVSNIAYRIGKELGCDDDFCNMLAVSGMVHDIGKLKVYDYLGIAGDDTLTVEKMKHIRMHSQLGYDILKQEGFSDDILEAVLYHHENYDGSGYPGNLSGDDIPLSARILRVCDVFAALISDRSYRKAFDIDTAIELMIDEVKNFDMNIFLTFMKIIHSVDINKITGKDV
jgi:putative nucleotidyltransferase with HDIG domain